MTEGKKDLLRQYREAQKKKREVKRKALGLEEGQSLGIRNYSEATKTRRAVKAELFGNKGKMTDTSIEIFVEEILKEKNIEYTPQKAVRFLNYDFYLIKENVLLEIQGDYYHVNPLLYKVPKNRLQREGLEKNKNKEDIASSKDIPLICIWELAIEKQPDQTKKRLLKAIDDLKNINEYKMININYEE